MKLKPLEDRVIVKAVQEEEKTASGIVLPDTAKEKPMLGEVIAVGEGKWDETGSKRIPVDVKVGDRVIYGKYSGTEYKTKDGDELLILRASEILAVVEK
jgi:chaperonin GroES